ncbi:UDP-glucose--hexose-1-phosphate uridylyltransferase [Anaeromicrobium sediminis]|uniref:Galactose-1-phosphate uridylyltransferase n=1 Tax=Anaeromicrobium sediminis TaxID=1478221 RepID=A0A267MGP3_9FIRM|nr:UDP-glucose--hexose-1-phosphate uridylyltransferase [Anaeromicrobium sediminis]PAB58572.1 UDP-glucose--hexose-1-phosphate uridylyltransferase [Anaeromicrobium sediminis]
MDINIFYEIDKLIDYGINRELIKEEDIIYTRNRILEILNLDEYKQCEKPIQKKEDLNEILDNILNWAYDNKILESNTSVYRDLLDSKIMGAFVKRPSDIIKEFNELYEEDPKKATDYFYGLSKDCNYIRMDRINKNLVWKTETPYGKLDITINLSKPEKDPKAIAAAKNMKNSKYPKCLLCKENEGYKGRLNHPARQNHRIIPIHINDEKWFLQYSPYVYYNEHSIIFKGEHEPMKICKDTFNRLLDFVEKFPHYFVGSNADLPIVGGSILSHDHFQGGCYDFPMAVAPMKGKVNFKGFEDVGGEIVSWYMSVVRIRSKNKNRLVTLGEKILNKWKQYSDSSVGIHSHTDDLEHNTITPIGRMRDGLFELDLVLRNNRTSEKYPLGIFHPHNEVHHIKKENIGLIEVMGLAVLPARLKVELETLKDILLNKVNIGDFDYMEKHREWYEELKCKYNNFTIENIDNILKDEVGKKFSMALEHAGVFKDNEIGNSAFLKFIDFVNN